MVFSLAPFCPSLQLGQKCVFSAFKLLKLILFQTHNAVCLKQFIYFQHCFVYPLIQFTEEREFKTDPCFFFQSQFFLLYSSATWLTITHQCHHTNVVNVANKVNQMLEKHGFRTTPCLPKNIFNELLRRFLKITGERWSLDVKFKTPRTFQQKNRQIISYTRDTSP